MKKLKSLKIILIIILVIIVVISVCAFLYFYWRFVIEIYYYQNRSVPDYSKIEMTSEDICKKVRNVQYRKLCFSIIENSDFNTNLLLVAKATNSDTNDFPWYFTDFGKPEKIREEGKDYNAENWCENSEKLRYFNCLAYLKNPYYCDKAIDRLSELNSYCFFNTAIIYRDPGLCGQVFYKYAKDRCYLTMILLNQKK